MYAPKNLLPKEWHRDCKVRMVTKCVIPKNIAGMSLSIVPISLHGRYEKIIFCQHAYDHRNPCSYMFVVAHLTCFHVAHHVFAEELAHKHTVQPKSLHRHMCGLLNKKQPC